MKVLYVNHTSQISGGERSLLTLLDALPAEVAAVAACPPGPLAEALRAARVSTHRLPGTSGSLRLHPWHTTRALAEMGRAALVLRRLAVRLGADLVHANTIRAGMVSALAARLGGPPVVVHVRDCLPAGRATELTRRLVANAACLISNSAYTAQCFGAERAGALSRVAHSPVDMSRFDPALITREAARARLGLAAETPVLAVVAQLTPWKAQDDAVRALARLKESQPDVRLLLVGSTKFVARATRYDNRGYLRSLEELIAQLGVGREVLLLGEREDVPEILRAVDVALVPSWEEPFGRTMVEAMAMEVPVVATEVGGPAEVIRHGEHGLLLPPRDPARWAAELGRLIEQPELRRRMGRAGRLHATAEFSAQRHAERVVAAYAEVLGDRGR